MLTSILFAGLALQAPAVLGAGTTLTVAWDDWVSLNGSVGGRLHFSTPFELPCFSSFAGDFVQSDPAECTVIQQNYTDPLFRSAHFGAFMNVSGFITSWISTLTKDVPFQVSVGDLPNYGLRMPT